MGKSYQEQMEELNPELFHGDDDEDITGDGGLDDEALTDDETSHEDDEESLEDSDADESSEEDDEEDKSRKKKEPLYTKDVVQKIVKTRVGTLTRKVDRLKGYQKAVEKICDITGLDFNTLVDRLESMTDDQQAKVLGLPVSQVRQVRETRRNLSREKNEKRDLQLKLGIIELRQDKRYRDIDLYVDEIKDILDDNPNLTVKQAYLLAKGDNVIEAAARDAEQRQVARRVNAQTKKIIKPSSGSGGVTTPKISREIKTAAKLAGMDPVEYIQFKNIRNLDQYNEYRKQKKKG